ncbi:MAG: ASPIC/UnbV domain-containing protein, partial [Myxococcota bacterium]|nr:ASPIC/UnbV domain-containing protein [Myxococcota bacterium]
VVVNLRGRRFADETQGKQDGPPRGGGEQLINQEMARQPEATSVYIWDEPINARRACAACGLGDIDKVDTLRVRWPDGELSEFESISTRQYLTITRTDP